MGNRLPFHELTSDDAAVARVNGAPILRAQVVDSLAMTPDLAAQPEVVDRLACRVVRDLVCDELYAQKAAELDVTLPLARLGDDAPPLSFAEQVLAAMVGLPSVGASRQLFEDSAGRPGDDDAFRRFHHDQVRLHLRRAEQTELPALVATAHIELFVDGVVLPTAPTAR